MPHNESPMTTHGMQEAGGFAKFRRSQIAELRPYVPNEKLSDNLVSISAEDIANGSPKIGDMIARNPKNHKDQWLVAAKYFADNFEPADRSTAVEGSGGLIEPKSLKELARVFLAAPVQDDEEANCDFLIRYSEWLDDLTANEDTAKKIIALNGCLRAPAAVSGKPDREAIAREIDPVAFEIGDGKTMYRPETMSAQRQTALLKADRILALPAIPSAGSVSVPRESLISDFDAVAYGKPSHRATKCNLCNHSWRKDTPEYHSSDCPLSTPSLPSGEKQ